MININIVKDYSDLSVLLPLIMFVNKERFRRRWNNLLLVTYERFDAISIDNLEYTKTTFEEKILQKHIPVTTQQIKRFRYDDN